MARLRPNGVGTPKGTTNPITVASATASTVSWTSVPTGMPLVASPNVVPLICTPGTATAEIMLIVAYTPGATSATVKRLPWGETGRTKQTLRSHVGKPWIVGGTTFDFTTNMPDIHASQQIR